METMGRKQRPRRSFTKEFKAEVVALVRQDGNTAASVARDLTASVPAGPAGRSLLRVRVRRPRPSRDAVNARIRSFRGSGACGRFATS